MSRAGGANSWTWLWLSLVACLGVVVVTRAQTLPEGRGRPEFERLCGKCHELERATRLRRTPEQWATIVDNMAQRGAEGTTDEFERVVQYLAANFGPDNPLPPPPASADRIR